MKAANDHAPEGVNETIGLSCRLPSPAELAQQASIGQHSPVVGSGSEITGLGISASPELPIAPTSDCESQPQMCCGGSCGTPMPRPPVTTETVEGHCESCGKTSHFPPDRDGKIEECPHCHEFLDVGELGWEMTDFGEPLD